jgi:hypothetical protein
MKVYKLVRSLWFFLWALLLFLTGIGVAVAVLAGREFTEGSPPGLKGLPLIWLGILFWIWYFYLKIPFEIRFRDDNLLEFKSVIRTTVVAPRDIISIKGVPLSQGFIKVRHAGGTIRLLCQITGLYELIYTVKTLNPEVEIQGC